MLDPVKLPVFFFNDTATTEIYSLSLHDALPICPSLALASAGVRLSPVSVIGAWFSVMVLRSGAHTTALQSHPDTVCGLLLVDAALVLPPTAASSVVREVKGSVSVPSNALVNV